MSLTFNPNLVLVDVKTGRLTRDGFILLQNLQGAISGDTFQPASDKLDGLAGMSDSPGIVTQTAANSFAKRTLQAPAAGIAIANASGAAADPQFTLADDLAGVEAITGTGLSARTAANTWATRTVTGTASKVTVTNGDGVSGNPTLTLPAIISQEGIGFPATQVASADPNTLDDYEEGTFTPTIIGTTIAGAGTYTLQVGKYTKIGNVLFFSLSVATSAHTGTGNMVIGGLPFTADSTANLFWTVFIRSSTTAFTTHMNSYVTNGTVQIAMEANNGGTVTALAIDATSTFLASGWYHV